ncbi:MAG: hypothetical protein IPH11_06025 [Ignavibacteriales bacterium]|nr:hypothetical protein [Ignavibacteriales bacterium]
MKYMLLLLIVFLCQNCTSIELNSFGKKETGGLLIAYDDINSTTLVLLEKELIIEPFNERIAFVNNLDLGLYTLSAELNNTNIIVESINVVNDSITILPLEYFIALRKDTISWIKHSFTFHSKIKDYGLSPNCSIAGKVIDGTSNKPINQAFVFLKEFPWWSDNTDEKGDFCINNILPGFFTAVCISQNYHKDKVINIQLCLDSVSRVEFYLTPSLIPEEPLNRIWSKNFIPGTCK